jgi:hypothetical protein
MRDALFFSTGALAMLGSMTIVALLLEAKRKRLEAERKVLVDKINELTKLGRCRRFVD